ncbi:Na+/H+ antiporter subunit E [Corynebacterium sp. H113]|uniref:Na+/H+ antiporter subunit E n=1 Tax=Corynebacterium sp. H113 TaxID=3133419 RepID=UPI00309511BF
MRMFVTPLFRKGAPMADSPHSSSQKPTMQSADVTAPPSRRRPNHRLGSLLRPRRRAARPSLVMFTWVIIMWVLLWGESSWGNIAGGIAVALLISILMPMPRVPVSNIRLNWPAMIRLFASWFIDFIKASFAVAWIALRRSDPPPGAIIIVPMRTRDDLTLASAIALINLQPGGLVIDKSRAHRTVTMHILDGSSTAKIDDTIAQLTRMERRVIRAFENRDVEDEE